MPKRVGARTDVSGQFAAVTLPADGMGPSLFRIGEGRMRLTAAMVLKADPDLRPEDVFGSAGIGGPAGATRPHRDRSAPGR
jgi:hypothetical protein